MPRSSVPRSTRTMYGTSTPWSVVVFFRSAGVGPLGSKGLKHALAGREAGGLGSGSAGERGAHGPAAQRDPQRSGGLALGEDGLDQGVAAADEVVPVRQRLDLEAMVVVLAIVSVVAAAVSARTGERRRDRRFPGGSGRG